MQYWYPNSAISWYYVSPALESISYTDHTNKNGLQSGASVLERYVISFYWVAATFTANGYSFVKTHFLEPADFIYHDSLVEDLIPSNEVEIIFCMILMVLNLTLFR